MRNNPVIQVTAALVTIGAVIAMVITDRGGFAPGLNSQPHRAAGAELARLSLSAMKPGGEIMVITRDTTTFPNPATDLLLKSFQRELRRAHAGVSSIQSLQLDPLRRIEVPSGDFQNWIHHAAGGDVIVSLVGPPRLTPEQWRELGEIKPAILAFCPGNLPDQVDFRSLLEQGRLRAAIVSRRHPPVVKAQPHGQPESFDQNFMVLTKANVDDFEAKPPAPTPP